MEQTNRKFAAENEAFKVACAKADDVLFSRSSSHKFGVLQKSPRQASKFRRGIGIVYKIMVGKGQRLG